MSKVIPDELHTAAQRGFIRTTAQAYSTALAGGISATIILGVVTGTVELIPTLITLGVTLVTPLLAGAASYLSIISRGIPAEYVAAEGKHAA